MASVVSGGTAERIMARILCSVLRAGSGTPARYSSTSFAGARMPFFIAPRDYHAGIALSSWQLALGIQHLAQKAAAESSSPWAHDARLKAQGSRLKVQSSNLEARGSRPKARCQMLIAKC